MVESYFSVSFRMISVGRPLAHDLYLNSSGLEGRERYVRLVKKGDTVSPSDLALFESKYHRLYVSEDERTEFLNSVCGNEDVQSVEKTAVLKDSAIRHLETLFSQDCTTEVLSRTLASCKETVVGMIDVLHDYSIDRLRELIGRLSFHDFYTFDHSTNVSMYCILIYQAIRPNASKSEIVQAGLGGLLHDLGKMRIPTRILNFAGKLSPDDFERIKKHPSLGRELIHQCKDKLPKEVDADLIARVIHEHHENFDGTGYPSQIAGTQIHLLSRVTAIADFFDAITTKRSYHEPLAADQALELMSKSRGKKLDPKLFEVFRMQACQSCPPVAAHPGHSVSLPSDFDPCQPQNKLRLIEMIMEEIPDQPENYGKVIRPDIRDDSAPRKKKKSA